MVMKSPFHRDLGSEETQRATHESKSSPHEARAPDKIPWEDGRSPESILTWSPLPTLVTFCFHRSKPEVHEFFLPHAGTTIN